MQLLIDALTAHRRWDVIGHGDAGEEIQARTTIKWVAQGVDDTTEKFLTHRNLQ